MAPDWSYPMLTVPADVAAVGDFDEDEVDPVRTGARDGLARCRP
jgi:hypothetical protein